MATMHSGRGLDRLVNFSDATVAIAITILILPLVDVAGDIARMSLGELIIENAGALLAFVISFLVIGREWMVHHKVFEFVVDYGAPLVWLNLIWLMSIVFLPFAANVLATMPLVDSAVIALYIGTIIVTTSSMVGMEWYLVSHPAMIRDSDPRNIELPAGIAVLVLFIVALVIATTLPLINLWALLILFLSGPTEVLLRRMFPRLPGRPKSA